MHVKEETRKKISESKKGRKRKPFSEEHKMKIKLAGIGHKHSFETRQKMTNSWREKIKNGYVNPNWGHSLSFEDKEKVRLSKLGKKRQPFSSEWKENMSKGQIKRYINKEKTNKTYSGFFGGLWKIKEYKFYIKERDDFKCQHPQCNLKNNKLIVHHIDYNKQYSPHYNLITLCRSCHGIVNYNRLYWKNYFQNLMIERNQVPSKKYLKLIDDLIFKYNNSLLNF